MPTDKPRFSVTLSDELNQKVLVHQARLQTQKSKAVSDLIVRGLRSLGLDDDPQQLDRQKNAPSLSDEALRLAFDFEALDHWGRQALLALAKAEQARVQAQEGPGFLMAASNGNTEIRSQRPEGLDDANALPDGSSHIPT